MNTGVAALPGPAPAPGDAMDAGSEPLDNAGVAAKLAEMAAMLEAQGGNPFRVAAYRKAATTVSQLGRSVRELFDREGTDGLDALPGVGPRIAAAIGEMLITGGWRQLDRLGGDTDPDALFRTIPGVGPELAKRLHQSLGVDTLEALESASREGRLEHVPGVGARRAATIRAALSDRLDRGRAPRQRVPMLQARQPPPVEWLLDVDREYRAQAEAGTLVKIAPRRFNPRGEAWLPVLHTQRGDWHFTALYSNTARAHELDRTHDWVVIYGEDKDHGERQYTVITATRGPLAGRRIVPGREAECRDRYRRP